MAASGVLLLLFVIGHMVGNLQVFLGPDVFNAYGEKLRMFPRSCGWRVPGSRSPRLCTSWQPAFGDPNLYGASVAYAKSAL